MSKKWNKYYSAFLSPKPYVFRKQSKNKLFFHSNAPFRVPSVLFEYRAELIYLQNYLKQVRLPQKIWLLPIRTIIREIVVTMIDRCWYTVDISGRYFFQHPVNPTRANWLYIYNTIPSSKGKKLGRISRLRIIRGKIIFCYLERSISHKALGDNISWRLSLAIIACSDMGKRRGDVFVCNKHKLISETSLGISGKLVATMAGRDRKYIYFGELFCCRY